MHFWRVATRLTEFAMDHWIPIQRWSECAQMVRPGFVFEIQNAAGQSMWTPCTSRLTPPLDWRTAPVRFRLVREAAPEHSSPLPAPRR
jgi:hypothetical protein